MENVSAIIPNRTRALRALMQKHRLTAADVGRILDRSPTTVRIWACRHDARTIPATALRLLELELERAA